MSLTEKMRIYKDGVIVGLAWDGTALNEAWRTGTFKGYIAGFGFSLLSEADKKKQAGSGKTIGDKKTEAGLYVAHLPRSGTFMGLLPGTGETELTVYELQFSSVKTK